MYVQGEKLDKREEEKAWEVEIEKKPSSLL